MIKKIFKTTTNFFVLTLAFLMIVLGALFIQSNMRQNKNTGFGAINVSNNLTGEHVIYEGSDGSGSGTALDPILVGSYNTFNTIVRNRSTSLLTYFVLINDIDLSPSSVWSPISTLAAEWVFDGNNYTIYNMKYYSQKPPLGLSQFGLFREIYGRIKNLNMGGVNISKVTNQSLSNSAALCYRAYDGAIFENITLESGIVFSSGYNMGGFVSLIDGGTITFRDCYNKVPIESQYNTGGFVARIRNSANVIFERCANLASVASTRQDDNSALAGGFVGTIEGISSNLTFDFCYNLGNVQGFHKYIGGFVGWVIGGTVTINNSFNDAEIVISNDDTSIQERKGAFTTRHSGTVNVNDCYFNETIFDGVACYNGGTITNQYDEPYNQPNLTSEEIRSQDFVDFLNDIVEEVMFELNDGRVGFAVLYQKYTLTFLPGEGDGEIYEIIRNKTDNETILPYNGMLNYPGLPTKVGYEFIGWLTDSSLYEAGDTFDNIELIDITFVAQFQKSIYEVVFVSATAGPKVIDQYGETSPDFSIGNEAGKSLSSSSWSGNYRWKIQLGGTSGLSDLDWVFLSEDQVISFSSLAPENSIGIDFINSFVDYEGYDSDPEYDGAIRLKIADISTSRLISITSNYDGGQLFIILDNDQLLQVPLNRVVSFPLTGFIKNITTTINNHYVFENIILYDESDDPVGDPITSQNYDSSEDERFNFNQLFSGYTIEVNFAKVEYEFRIYAALKGQEDIELDEELINEISVSKISIYEEAVVNVTALPESILRNYCFVTFKIYDVLEDLYFNSDFHVYTYNKNYTSSEINEEWLEKYLKDNQFVIIIAEYIEAYSVSVTTAEGQSNFGHISIKVVDSITKEETSYSKLQNEYIVKDSSIEIVANPEKIYEFDYFLNVGAENYKETNKVVIEVNETIDILAVFKYKNFVLEFLPKDQSNRTINSVNGFTSYVNGQENSSSLVKVTDVLNGPLFTGGNDITGYRFISFTIKNELGETIALTDDIFVSEEILRKNLNKWSKFIVYANYVSRLTLTLTQQNEYLGNVKVFLKGEEEETPLREFDYGTEIVIIANANRFGKLNEINPIFGHNTGEQEGNNKLNLTMTFNRSIVFNFVPLKLEIKNNFESLNGGVTTISSLNELNVGDRVVLTVNADFGKELKSWEINGISVDELPDNMTYEKNTLTITITDEWLDSLTWLDDDTFILESEAIFGMTSTILFAIIAPSVIIPMLILILVLYYIILNKRKMKIKAELQQQQAINYKMNTSSFISDLREGKNVGQVTKEDIKREMKNRKKKK